MGANMARRLKDQKFNITAVYDTNRKIATELAVELVCAAAQDLSQVTAESDVIFTVVTDDNAMRRIFSDSGDNLLKNARGKLFINCATISPQVHVDVEKLAEKAGAESLEDCMASSITQALEGKLYLMCGGSEKAFRRAEPILKELAASVRFIGKAGEAAKVKALVNMVMNINTAGLAEGLGLGAALGVADRGRRVTRSLGGGRDRRRGGRRRGWGDRAHQRCPRSAGPGPAHDEHRAYRHRLKRRFVPRTSMR